MYVCMYVYMYIYILILNLFYIQYIYLCISKHNNLFIKKILHFTIGYLMHFLYIIYDEKAVVVFLTWMDDPKSFHTKPKLCC